MKKRVISLLIIVLIASTCFVTSATATAEPTITKIHGGYGVTATVIDAIGHRWNIKICGQHMIFGSKAQGIISRNNDTIRTHIIPPAFGFGKILINITIERIFKPDITEVRTAYILGPYVFFVRNIPC